MKRWALLALAFAACHAAAQAAFPTKPVRMVVAFTAGSETDYLARIVGQKLSDQWGQQVVVENRPGAGGVLASNLVATAPGDGHTLFMHSMAFAITPAINAKLPFDTLKDFVPVSQVAGVPNVLVVTPNAGIQNARDLVARAKAQPGKLTFSSAGIGSGMHINGEQFRLAAEIDVVHVAYRGGPEALADTMAGRVDYVFSPIGLAIPMIRDRKLVPLGVSTAARSPALPEVPTIAEAALPGFDFDTWYGLFAPGTTPRPLVAQISADVNRVIALPDVREKFSTRGAVPRASTPQEFDRFVRAEIEKLARVVKAAGVKAE